MRLCCEGPLVQVDPGGTLYGRVTPENAGAIIAAAAAPRSGKRHQDGDLSSPFFTKQMPIVLENSGVIEPERIESYLAAERLRCAAPRLAEMTPRPVIER